MSDKDDLAGYYKELYEKETARNEKLTRELVESEADRAELRRKMDVLKNSLLFRMIRPARNLWARIRNVFIRVKRYGSLKEVIRKIKSKRIERSAYKLHGTESFPSQEEREQQRTHRFKHEHIFAIMVPLYNTPEKFLREFIESVTAQTYEGWELCLADGSDDEHSYVADIVREFQAEDGKNRIRYKKLEKNGGISVNTNECFTLASGDWYALMDHDDLIHPSLLYEYMKVLDEQDAYFIYCDEATFSGESIDNMITMHFKPDFAVDNLRANNYICHFSAFRKELSDKCGKFRSEFDGSQDHDMILRLTAEASKREGGIAHVQKVLYYWRSHAGSTAADINAKTYAIDAAKGAVASHLTACGFRNFEIESTRAFATIFRIRYALDGKPKVSIIIPNKDHAEDLRRCITSVMTRSSYDNFEIIIVDNGSAEKTTEEYYNELSSVPCIKVIKYDCSTGFNYPEVINAGAAEASGEYLLLLNNDTEVITRNWIEEMLMYAQRDDVGAVGCKLYYPDYTIQHAGIVIGLGAHRTAGHTHYRLSRDNLGYMGRLCYAQDVSAVTGACLMVSKKDFESTGGLDENFAVALNDVDFCLKLRKKGRLNIFTPFAELFHYESLSRGRDDDGSQSTNAERYEKEAALFRNLWKKELAQGDPYYNPNFSLDHSNYTLKGRETPRVSE